MIKKIRNFFGYVEVSPLIYTEQLRDAYLTKSVVGSHLKGKKVMITGGTGGIGTALILRFLGEGCHVMCCARNKNKLQATISYINKKFPFAEIESILMDLESEESIRAAVESLGDQTLDILINNAGVFTDIDIKRKFLGVTRKEFINVWNVNYKGTVFLSNIIAEKMSKNGAGSIVNISSICANSNKTQYTPYGMSKAAIKEFTRLLADKYRTLQVNAILPGAVATSMGNLGIDENIARNSNVLHHPALPEEIAALAAFLSAGAGRYINEEVVASACEVL